MTDTGVNGVPGVRPYAASAATYLSRGFAPIPLPAGAKYAPPTGWTGYDAPYPSGADVEEWASNGRGGGNVGLRLAETVIGIDVDAYGGKQGWQTFCEAISRLGDLPPTYTSTSRGDVSGIQLFRVPPGRAWADTLGPDVEIIHWGHRYIVAAPSIHPEGRAYRWIGPDGAQVSGPAISDLPELPEAWVRELDRGPASDRAHKADVTLPEVLSALRAMPEGQPCEYLSRVLAEANRALMGGRGSRHDTVRGHIGRIIRAGEQGHEGAQAALRVLRTTWLIALQDHDTREPDKGEWERMVAGAVAIVKQDPTPEVDRRCCGPAPRDTAPLSFEPEARVEVEGFWDERPVLAHINVFARARMVSPWAVLGCVLARTVVAVPPSVVLPPIVGGYASLNLFIGATGPSGSGKGAAESAAEDAVDYGTVPIDVATVGSGEGIGHLYAHREKGEVVRDRTAVLFTVPEVDNLAALTGRQGATLLPQLRSAWSGEKLGFSYADKNKALPIAKHTYRMGLVLGIQPGRAEPLLSDSDGGTPQRFVWLPTTDPDAPEELPETPDPWIWPGTGPLFGAGMDGFVVLDVCQVARETIVSNRRARLRGDGDALDGHSLLCRLKVAAALGLLDGRQEVSSDDWRLAGIVMAVSDATRARVAAYLSRQRAVENTAKGVAEGQRSVVVTETVTKAKVARVCRLIQRKLDRSGKVASRKQLRGAVNSADRDVFEEAMTLLEESGQIETDREGKYRVR